MPHVPRACQVLPAGRQQLRQRFPGLSVDRAIGGSASAGSAAAVAKRLEDEILSRRGGHIHAGITGGYFVIKDLLESGRGNLILEMATKEDYPRLGQHAPPRRNHVLGILGGRQLALAQFLSAPRSLVDRGAGGIQPDPEQGGFQTFITGRISSPGG